MDEVESVCAECRKPPNNPHVMLCGHTFCLSPCLLPENSDQKFVCCPLCQIETRVIDLKPMSRDQPENLDALSANSETMRSCPKQSLSQHSSKTVCPACVGNYESEVS
nr:unnamed protein product [Spirometra erinaceieuropaei]